MHLLTWTKTQWEAATAQGGSRRGDGGRKEVTQFAPFPGRNLACSSRQALAQGSPERQRRMNSVINWLVALALTFQWLASTVCAPAMRMARRHWQERTHWL
jgi:hypothetical protein